MSSNSFAKKCFDQKFKQIICLQKQKEKTHKYKIANIENNLKKKYESDLGALEKLFTAFINNDFCEADNSRFLIISHVVLKAKNNKRLIMIPINESLEPLANAFIYAVYAGNLWIHTCQRCGKLFLSDTDEKYCQAKKRVNTKYCWINGKMTERRI